MVSKNECSINTANQNPVSHRFHKKKLSNLLEIKNKSKFEYQYDVIYERNTQEENRADTYIIQKTRGISGRIIEHNGRDQNFCFLKHSCSKHHHNAGTNDFKILSSNFKNLTFNVKLEK